MTVKLVELRFKGRRQHVYVNRRDIDLKIGDYCIVRADRGEDMGRVIHLDSLDRSAVSDGKAFDVIRKATAPDGMALFRNRSREEDARRICLTRIETRKLDMKLVDVEMQFDGNKITFFFTAEKRIDFRELVKDLASTFKTRIELRQIGVRDEAKRMDGVGPCGKRLCCSQYLREFQPITLKMARDQHLALSPNKISGVCGRLMCCLAYERGLYVETLKSFPRIGSRVRTRNVEGKTVKADVFSRMLAVRTAEGEEVRISVEELTEVMRDGKWIPFPGRKEKKPQ